MKSEWAKYKKLWKNWGKAHTRSLFGKIRENPGNSVIFSAESRRIIHSLGNIELYELGQMSSTIQFHSCFKHLPEGLKSVFAECVSDQTKIHLEKIKHDFKRWLCHTTLPSLIVPKAKSAVNPSGKMNHSKAVDATRAAKTHGHKTITIRWQGDEKYWVHSHVETKTQTRKYFDTGLCYKRSSMWTHE